MKFMLMRKADEDTERGTLPAGEVFDQLQQDGQIFMPFAETFWTKGFGMATDRFGTHWMIGYGTGQTVQQATSEGASTP